MASLKTFLPKQGTESARCTIFRSDAMIFSVGFRWSVGRLKGRSDERRSVGLPPYLYIARWGRGHILTLS